MFPLSFLLVALCLSLGSATSIASIEGLVLGESNDNDFAPIYNPVYRLEGGSLPKLIREDERNTDRLVEQQINGQLFDLHSFVGEVIGDEMACASETLKRQSSYLRYLYRLMTLSYLYESLRRRVDLVNRLELKAPTCDVSWKSLFDRCRPMDPDLLNFVKRSKYIIDRDDLAPVKSMSVKKDREYWLSELLKNKIGPFSSANHMVYLEGLFPRSFNAQNVSSQFEKSCQRDVGFFRTICNEKDFLYGLSSIPMASQILSFSEPAKILGMGGRPRFCLRRYTDLMKNKETQYGGLGKLFDAVFLELKKFYPGRSVLGKLFLAGSFKKFDQLGFKVTLKDKELKVQPKQKKYALRPTPVPTLKAEVVTRPKTQIKKVVKKNEAPAIEYIEEAPEISAFESAVAKFDQARKKGIVKSVEVDMQKFDSDFVFTNSFLNKVQKKLDLYKTRQALNEMKKFDKFGSYSQPVRLLFIKYLITMGDHHGLYNLTGVLGSEFYVVNDIDGKKRPIYVFLENNLKTQGQWLIKLKRAPKRPSKEI